MSLQEELCWRRIQQLQEENITVTGHIVGINRGGLMVDVLDVRGFMPMSHVPSVRKAAHQLERDKMLCYLWECMTKDSS